MTAKLLTETDDAGVALIRRGWSPCCNALLKIDKRCRGRPDTFSCPACGTAWVETDEIQHSKPGDGPR